MKLLQNLSGDTVAYGEKIEETDEFFVVDDFSHIAESQGPFSITDGDPPAIPPRKDVPKSVTRRQARAALLLRGVLDTVPGAIAAIPDATQRRLAEIEWEDSQVFERDRPLVRTLGGALGLTGDQIDDLFIFAATL